MSRSAADRNNLMINISEPPVQNTTWQSFFNAHKPSLNGEQREAAPANRLNIV